MKHTLYRPILALALLATTACTGEKFHVEGTITGAADSTLYFEQISLDGLVTLDSTKLNSDGTFSFASNRTDAPEFYCLRIAGQTIALSIDSTETVTVKADYPHMADGYKVEGSEECEKIRQLTLMQMALQQKVMALEANRALTAADAEAQLQQLLDAHKQKVESEYIFKDPQAASSYYALFQTIGRYLIFNPRSNADDVRAFAAVATSWDTFYPGSLRGENLHNITIEGMKNTRIMAANSQPMQVDESKVTTAGLIDLTLPDNKGRERSLSQLKGKVVMLDFHLFSMKESTARILHLRELYNKYKDRGFEIYQVSLDPDEHFWKQQTEALPWISVRDADGVNARSAAVYNVQQLPEYFLIDRDNNLVGRSSQIESLEGKIEEML